MLIPLSILYMQDPWTLLKMKNTYESIQDIAASVGYENAMTFSRMFKNSFGISPSEYREHHNTEIKGDIE